MARNHGRLPELGIPEDSSRHHTPRGVSVPKLRFQLRDEVHPLSSEIAPAESEAEGRRGDVHVLPADAYLEWRIVQFLIASEEDDAGGIEKDRKLFRGDTTEAVLGTGFKDTGRNDSHHVHYRIIIEKRGVHACPQRLARFLELAR